MKSCFFTSPLLVIIETGIYMIEENNKQWNFLTEKFESDQLSHAYLLSGPEGVDTFSFAKKFIQLINCLPAQAGLDRKKEACKKCQNCRMIEQETFPDLLTVRSSQSDSSQKNEKDMMEIEVKQIRDTQHFLSYKSYYGSFKAVVIEHAERMTREAQNCFLKTLEEPKGKTIIFLLTTKPSLLLQTIFSRCQEVRFFHQGTYDLSKEETAEFKGLENILQGSLAEKFKYAKTANIEGEQFDKLLGTLRKHFRQQLIKEVGDNNGEAIKKSKKLIELIENISHQKDISNINNKLALELILMEI